MVRKIEFGLQTRRITSVILLFGSMVRVFFGFSLLNVYSSFKSVKAIDDRQASLYGAACIFLFLSCFLEFASGLVGIINSEESKYGFRCTIWGMLTLAVALSANILQIMCGYGTSIYTWLTGLVTPVMFVAAFLMSFVAWKRREETGR